MDDTYHKIKVELHLLTRLVCEYVVDNPNIDALKAHSDHLDLENSISKLVDEYIHKYGK